MRKIIFDGDPGIDDALAIILALQSSELQLLGITTVFGNVDVNKGTRNALSILEYFGRADIPVARGTEKPLFKEFKSAESVHGKDGLGNINLHPPRIRQVSQPAEIFISETVKQHPNDVTIVATGPLTNIAGVINTNSEFSIQVNEVVIMGGAVFVPGNVSPHAEYNVWADAEAAKIVLESGLPITLVPLDVTMSFYLSTNHFAQITKEKTLISRLIAQMLPFYINAHKKRGVDGCYLHDPLAMGVAFDPTLLTSKKMGIEVITSGNQYGRTIPNDSSPPIKVSLEVDHEKFLRLFIDRMTKKL
jgi:purine nucleosidase